MIAVARATPASALSVARTVTLRRALFDDHFQIGLLVHSLGRGERWQVGRDESKVEGQCGGELAGRVDDPGPAREAASLFGVAAQVRQRTGVEPPLHLLQALARAQRREHVGAREGIGRGVVHVVRRHERHVVADGRFGEDVVARDVIGRAVVPDLDRDVVATEGGDEPFEFALGRARTSVHQGARHRTLATATQYEPLALCARDLFEGETRRAFFAAAQVGLAEHRRERAVPLGRARE